MNVTIAGNRLDESSILPPQYSEKPYDSLMGVAYFKVIRNRIYSRPYKA